MKSGVEDGDLRNWPQKFCDDLHAFQFCMIVKWRKNGSALDGGLDLGCNQRRLEMLRASVDYAVPDNIDIGRGGNGLGFITPQAPEQALNGCPARTVLGHVAKNAAGIPDRITGLAVGPIDLAFPHRSRWILWERLSHFVETTFLAARTRVENENSH